MTSLEIVPSLRSRTISRALRLEHLAHDRLVGDRAVLEAVVLDLARARRQPPLAVLVGAAHALDRVVARPLLAGQLLDPGERGLGRVQPRLELLVLLLGAVVLDAEPADQRRQRQPLQHERDEDHREREEDQQVALLEVDRERERRGERDRAAHPGPADDRAARQSPRRARCDSRRSIARIRKTSEWLHTSRVSTTAALTAARVAEPASGSKSSRHQHAAAAARSARTGTRSSGTRAAPTCRSPAAGSPARRSSAPASRRSSPTVTAASTAESSQVLGRHVGRVAAQQADRVLDQRVVEPLADLDDHPADGEPDRDPARRLPEEVPARVQQRERAAPWPRCAIR